MADCDICGKTASGTAFVEGALVEVCHRCAKLGRPAPSMPTRATHPSVRMKDIELVQGYGHLIRTARQRVGLSTLELARKLSIQEGVIKQLEMQTHAADLTTLHKIEAELNIALIEQVESEAPEEHSRMHSPSSEPTLGDVAFMKRQKEEK